MDHAVLQALILPTLAGITIPLGAFLARFDVLMPGWMQDEFRHSVMAFGGGALFSAIALVLVPEGIARVQAVPAILAFAAGGVVFGFLDYTLSSGTGRFAQFMAMMLDYVPEAMALGAMLSGQTEIAVLLAGLIALQNLPEGFNAWREMTQDHNRPGLIWVFMAVVLVGPLAALIGLFVLTNAPAILGTIMLFSAGGILYLIFEDVAPHVPLEHRWGPPLGAVAGFLLGLAGHLASM
ncbi:ZIP family metal transporter [Marivita sp. S0852]|uniref:ZIP family metal transporter n=1 Tax=Marivita sp. S0852 TaxID=3373893 RepID=UPI0039827CA7